MKYEYNTSRLIEALYAKEDHTSVGAASHIQELLLHVAQLKSRLESLEKDAARHRWLSAQHWVEPEAVFRLGLSDTEDFGEYQRELDSAIDTAMQAKKA